MFSHPAAVLGFIIMAIGWFMLVGGGASGYDLEPRGFINFHTLWIASGMILTGGTLIVGGVVAGGAKLVHQALLFLPDIAAGHAAFQKSEEVRKKEESEYRTTGKKPAKVAVEKPSPADAEAMLQRTLREKGLS